MASVKKMETKKDWSVLVAVSDRVAGPAAVAQPSTVGGQRITPSLARVRPTERNCVCLVLEQLPRFGRHL